MLSVIEIDLTEKLFSLRSSVPSKQRRPNQGRSSRTSPSKTIIKPYKLSHQKEKAVKTELCAA